MILDRIMRPRAEVIATSMDLDNFLRRGSGGTWSGATVSAASAMQLSAVYDCVRVLAEGIAQLPLHLYRRLPGGGKERVLPARHPVARIITAPNEWQTAYEWVELMAAHLTLAGNAYNQKTMVQGEIRELLPLSPAAVTPVQDQRKRVTYEVRPENAPGYVAQADQIVHVRGVSLDGLVGMNPIQAQRETLGLGIQLNMQGARFFKNGAQLTGILQHPAHLSREAAERVRDSFEETYSGADNAWKIAILEEGMKFEKTGMTAEDAQFLESRKASRVEIASLFRVPPHMIGEFDRATWNNIEHAGQDFVTYTLGSHLRRIEQRLSTSLLNPDERGQLFLQFLVEGYLRGDTATRFGAYQTALQNAWMSVNEVRERENMNPVAGGDAMGRPTTAPAPGTEGDPSDAA